MRNILILLSLLSLSMPVAAQWQGGDAPPVITQAISKIVPRLQSAFLSLQKGDLLVLDLDNTVFREAQMLGTDEWYSHQLQEMISRGMSKDEAGKRLELINNAIKTESKMRLMEPAMADLIRRLQERGVFVIGLTARHPTLADTTIEHLHELGVEFRRSRVPEETLVSLMRLEGLEKYAFRWRAGVAFTDGAPKGEVLKHLITRAGLSPKKVIAVDDRIHHVHSFVEALLEMKIEGRVIHYLKVREEPPFDPRIADLQFRAFRRLGRLISDADAQSRLRPINCDILLSGLSR